MKIIDINIIGNIDSFVDAILKLFSKKNENYLLIKEEDSYQIHFEGYIIRLYRKEYSKNDKVYILPLDSLEKVEFGNLFEILKNKNIMSEIKIQEFLNFSEPRFIDLEPKIKKENPALKKLKKNDYKKSKGARLPFKKYR